MMSNITDFNSNSSQPTPGVYCEMLKAFYTNLPQDFYVITCITCVLNILTSISASFGNILVLTLLLRKRSLHNNSNILLIWLSTSDAITGLVTQPICVVRDVSVLKRDPLCSMFSAGSLMSTLCVGLSLLTLALITIDRYLALFFPFSYNIHVTKKRIMMVTASTWACWLIVDVIAFIYFMEFPHEFTIVLFCILISCTLILASVVYCKIFFMAKRHRSSIMSQRRAAGHDIHELEGEYRIMSRTLLIVVVMFLCYAPSLIYMVVELSLPQVAQTMSVRLWPWLNWIVFANSSINVILYCLRIPTLRCEIMRLLKLDSSLGRVTSWELSTTRTVQDNNPTNHALLS